VISPSKEVAVDEVQVGTILYSSWGYDQTNVDFYVVTAVTAASVKIGRISKTRTSDSNVVPDFTSQPIVLDGWRRFKNGSCRIHSSACAYLWDGKPKYETPWGYGH